MNIIRWIAGGILCLFGVYIVLYNYGALIVNVYNRKKGIDKCHSQQPIVGPASWILGCILIPVNLDIVIWLAWLVDPSTWVLGISLSASLKELREDKKNKKS